MEDPPMPNESTLFKKVMYSLAALAAVIWSSLGVYNDDLFLPGKHSSSIRLHGIPVVIGALAFYALSGALLVSAFKMEDARRPTAVLTFTYFFLFVVACLWQIMS